MRRPVQHGHRQGGAGPLAGPEPQVEERLEAEGGQDDRWPASRLRCPATRWAATAGSSSTATSAATDVAMPSRTTTPPRRPTPSTTPASTANSPPPRRGQGGQRVETPGRGATRATAAATTRRLARRWTSPSRPPARQRVGVDAEQPGRQSRGHGRVADADLAQGDQQPGAEPAADRARADQPLGVRGRQPVGASPGHRGGPPAGPAGRRRAGGPRRRRRRRPRPGRRRGPPRPRPTCRRQRPRRRGGSPPGRRRTRHGRSPGGRRRRGPACPPAAGRRGPGSCRRPGPGRRATRAR